MRGAASNGRPYRDYPPSMPTHSGTTMPKLSGAQHLPDLAASLNNQSARLAELGRREDAFGAIDEAVRIYRTLADARPDAFRSNLAASLNNQSTFLSELVGRGEDALVAIDEAVSIYRALADARPEAFLPDLAMSLSNQSGRLSDLGRREDAVTVIDHAVRLILPALERSPFLVSDLGQRMAKSYVRRCREVGRDPDSVLIERLDQVLLSAGQRDADDERADR